MTSTPFTKHHVMVYNVLKRNMLPINVNTGQSPSLFDIKCTGSFTCVAHRTNGFTSHPKDKASWLAGLYTSFTAGTRTHTLLFRKTRAWVIYKSCVSGHFEEYFITCILFYVNRKTILCLFHQGSNTQIGFISWHSRTMIIFSPLACVLRSRHVNHLLDNPIVPPVGV